MTEVAVRELASGDRAWAEQVIAGAWGSVQIVTRGRIHDVRRLPGLVAVVRNERAGLLTYRLDPPQLEILSLNSLQERCGVGGALLRAVQHIAREQGCRRIRLITSNDNTPAIRFYQKNGYHLCALYPNALEHSRRLKPSIPMRGLDGIPLRDEIELEFLLDP